MPLLASVSCPTKPRLSVLRDRPKQELLYLLVGLTVLVALTLLLPLVDTLEPHRTARIVAYALVLIAVGSTLHGFLLGAEGYATSRLLTLGAAAASIGVLFALLARPENLETNSGFVLLLALSAADFFRVLAAAAVGVSLARYVKSVGVVVLIVVVAMASDLFSVFVGPTNTLVKEDSPALDVLLLVFPTFGSALGFGLGVSDFIFLALFAAASRFLNLRYLATLLCVCFGTFLALSAGLLLERPLPALPFIAIAFVLANADFIVALLAKGRRSYPRT
jgi:hypothetical protein